MTAAASPAPWVIRPWRTGDDLFALILPIQQQEFAIPVTAADQPDLADIDGFYRRGKGEFWVAAIDDGPTGGRIVGSVALLDLSAAPGGAGLGVIRKMFVAADQRGSGLAQSLLDALFDHARSAGLTELWLGTTEKFRAAHRFYERNGFAVVEPADLPAAFPRMAVDTRFYRLDL
ncbi:MAG TPA: GNAT family N-acetyltransferase [Azospirillaceae bacterium]|nr:GNAT family N-acetyltransferase [Azospirillaceae bacterium]